MKRLSLVAFAVVAVLGGRVSPVFATTTGVYGGDTFTLSWSSVTDVTDNDAYQVTLQVQTSGTTEAGNFIDAVSVSLGGPVESATGGPLFASTNGTTGGNTGTWDFSLNATNSNGCLANSNTEVCDQMQTTSPAEALDNGTTYTWNWIIDTTVVDPSNLHVKAVWDNATTNKFADQVSFLPATGNTTGITTTTTFIVPSTPEPATLVLFGTGLALAARRVRRKKNRD